MGKISTLIRDRQNAERDKVTNENKLYQKIIDDLQNEVTKKRVAIIRLDAELRDQVHHSSDDLRAKRKLRAKLNKERKQLQIKIDLMKK
jgi:hypothetical protein